MVTNPLSVTPTLVKYQLKCMLLFCHQIQPYLARPAELDCQHSVFHNICRVYLLHEELYDNPV